MNFRSATAVVLLLGVATELPAQAHTHEEIGYRPPTLFNFNVPSASGNFSSGGSLDGVIVASLPAPRATLSAVQQTRVPFSHRLASYSPRTHPTRTNKHFYRNTVLRKTIPRS